MGFMVLQFLTDYLFMEYLQAILKQTEKEDTGETDDNFSKNPINMNI